MTDMNLFRRESLMYVCVLTVLCAQFFCFESSVIDGLGSLQGQLTSLKTIVSQDDSKPLSTLSLYSQDQTERKVLASILGAAVGDALGRVTEFTGFSASLPRLNTITLKYYAQNYLIDDYIIYTDDTVMAKIVLETALEGRDNKWSDQEIIGTMAARFIPWTIDPWMARSYGIEHLDSNLYQKRAHGGANAAAMLRNYQSYQSNPTAQWWDGFSDSKKIQTEGGCGSVMRAWPLGLVFYKNPKKAEELAIMQSRITHRLPMAQAACGSLAIGIAYALNGESIDYIARKMIESADSNYDAAINRYSFLKSPLVRIPGVPFPVDELGRSRDVVGFRDELRTWIAQNRLNIGDMLRYAQEAALRGDEPDVVLGTANDKGSSSNGFRSKSGALLGWAADEALAAALYIFIRYTDENQIEKRKADFSKQGRVWDDKSIIWYAIQEGVATVGDSDSIASLTGALMGAYHSVQIPISEENVLVNKLESFPDFVRDAHWVVTSKKTGALPELTIKTS